MASPAEIPRRPWLALALLLPVPAVGVTAAMVWPGGTVGHAIFLAAKVWLVALPATWHLLVDGGRPSWSPPRRGGLGVGLLLGLATAAVIGVAAWLAAGALEPAAIRAEVVAMGLGTRGRFLLAAAGWVGVNSVLEEYVWRWFAFHQLEAATGSGAVAVVASALGFTLHHVVALATYLGPGLVALASSGVFLGGLTWSLLYRRFRSIWPGWLAHAGADVAIFAVAYRLLFA